MMLKIVKIKISINFIIRTETSRFIYDYIIEKFPNNETGWLKKIAFEERMKKEGEMGKTLRAAVNAC